MIFKYISLFSCFPYDIYSIAFYCTQVLDFMDFNTSILFLMISSIFNIFINWFPSWTEINILLYFLLDNFYGLDFIVISDLSTVCREYYLRVWLLASKSYEFKFYLFSLPLTRSWKSIICLLWSYFLRLVHHISSLFFLQYC